MVIHSLHNRDLESSNNPSDVNDDTGSDSELKRTQIMHFFTRVSVILPSSRLGRMRRFTRYNTLSTIWDVITGNNDWTAECCRH